MKDARPSIAIWALTPDGARLAQTIARRFRGASVFTGQAVSNAPAGAISFSSLADAVAGEFSRFEAHVFIMAAGIAVRMIAPHIGAKQTDPAVVAIDDAGHFAISLLSGHAGGANHLAGLVAGCTGAMPVITTATDNAGVPAIDVLAKSRGLAMENPEAVKAVSMAFLTGSRVWLYDPRKILANDVEAFCEPVDTFFDSVADAAASEIPGIFVDPAAVELPKTVLIVRPRVLAVGAGCNRNTPAGELICAVQAVFDQYGLSVRSIDSFVTIEEKTREPGMIEMADYYGRPLRGYPKEELAAVRNIESPSKMVHKHMGVESVCEAAAMIQAKAPSLLIPKQKTKNTTVAVAEKPFT